MAVIQKRKPTSPGQRGTVVIRNKALTSVKPEASLLRPKKRINGRNNKGRITVRHRGGGHKKHYRIIDWKRNDKTHHVVTNITPRIIALDQSACDGWNATSTAFFVRRVLCA